VSLASLAMESAAPSGAAVEAESVGRAGGADGADGISWPWITKGGGVGAMMSHSICIDTGEVRIDTGRKLVRGEALSTVQNTSVSLLSRRRFSS
jgi:hypothetical protein